MSAARYLSTIACAAVALAPVAAGAQGAAAPAPASPTPPGAGDARGRPMTLPEYRFPVYHGRGGETRFLTYQGSVPSFTGPPAPTHYAARRAVLCFDVVNALSAVYTYGREVRVDTVVAALPDFSAIVAALGANIPAVKALPGGTGGQMKLVQVLPVDTVWRSQYRDSLTALRGELDTAIVHAQAAHVPEHPTELNTPPQLRMRGLAYAQAKLRAMGSKPGEFNDPKLKETVARWAAEAKRQLPQTASSDDRLVLAGFDAVGQSLVAAIDRVRREYVNVPERASVCDTVRAERTEIRLNILARDPAGGVVRDTGVARLALVNEAPYDVPFITLDPMLLFSGTREAADVAVDADGAVTVTPAARRTRFRPGLVLGANFSPLGRYAGFVASPFAGFGFGDDGKGPFSDALLGATFGFRDAFRVGVGWGYSAFVAGVKPDAVEGGKLKAGTKLDDALRSDWRSSLSLVFSFKGLPLKNKSAD